MHLAVFQSLKWHYELLHHYITFAERDNHTIHFYINLSEKEPINYLHKLCTDKTKIISYKKFGITKLKDYDAFFIPTDDDPCWKSMWTQIVANKILCIGQSLRRSEVQRWSYRSVSSVLLHDKGEGYSLIGVPHEQDDLVQKKTSMISPTPVLMLVGIGMVECGNMKKTETLIKRIISGTPGVKIKFVLRAKHSNMVTERILNLPETEIIEEPSDKDLHDLMLQSTHTLCAKNHPLQTSGSLQLALTYLSQPIIPENSACQAKELQHAFRYSVDSDDPITLEILDLSSLMSDLDIATNRYIQHYRSFLSQPQPDTCSGMIVVWWVLLIVLLLVCVGIGIAVGYNLKQTRTKKFS